VNLSRAAFALVRCQIAHIHCIVIRNQTSHVSGLELTSSFWLRRCWAWSFRIVQLPPMLGYLVVGISSARTRWPGRRQ
jgi:hypothetical protein